MKYMRNLLVIILIALTALGPAALAQSATVNSSEARFYRSPSTDSASIMLGKGTTVDVKAASGEWAKVSLRSVTGYVLEKYLTADSRYAAYISRKTYIYRKASTSSAKRSVSVNTKIYVLGKSGGFYKVQNSSGSATGYVLTGCVSRSRVTTGAAWKSKVVKAEWFNGGSGIMKTGSYAYIYDIATGITLRIKRMGGHNHADVEPATAADTAKLLKVAGGAFSWDAHAVILHAGGRFVACSINTMPHGDQTITTNNYNGQFCLHMTGSTTHGTQTVNANHQAAINRAYEWSH